MFALEKSRLHQKASGIVDVSRLKTTTEFPWILTVLQAIPAKHFVQKQRNTRVREIRSKKIYSTMRANSVNILSSCSKMPNEARRSLDSRYVYFLADVLQTIDWWKSYCSFRIKKRDFLKMVRSCIFYSFFPAVKFLRSMAFDDEFFKNS